MQTTFRPYFLTILLLLSSFVAVAQASSTLPDDLLLQQVGSVDSVKIVAVDADGTPLSNFNASYQLEINGTKQELQLINGEAGLPLAEEPEGLYFITDLQKKLSFKLYHISGFGTGNLRIKHLPLWLSILPPLLAIMLALIFKEVLVSLFSGVWLGAFIVNGMRLELIPLSFLNTVDKYAIDAVMDSGHASIIIFSLVIGGMVAVISKNGGMQGVVDFLSRYARTKRSAQFVTWFLGIAIFFDDYANTLIVGNTMRPVSDRFKISREKLAYLVDSTAAPVASIAFITTWIGAELGYIGDAIEKLGLDQNAYGMFVGSLEYAYYPIFTLVFMFFLILMQRDFGPMYQVELAAAGGGKTGSSNAHENDDEMNAMSIMEGITPKAINAVLPILTVIVMTLVGLVYTGYDAAVWDGDTGFINKLSATFGNADSYRALLWSSISGLMMAILMTLTQRQMSLAVAMDTTVKGFKSLLIAMLILVLAWSLAAITEELHTAGFLTALMVGKVNPFLMPTITFILAAGVSFSTGSSWSTMAILFPILLPTSFTLCQAAGLDMEVTLSVLYNVIAVIMGGSVFGDHCSPISDTTILSSLASGCNHIDHVRTQIPYALTVGAISILAGGIFFYLSIPWYLEYLLGFGVLYLVARYVGKAYPVEG